LAISKKDSEDLRYAKSLLENPSLAAKITHVLGKSIEKGFGLLPENFNTMVNSASKKALEVAMDAAMTTMNKKRQKKSQDISHKIAVAMSGSVGGFMGLPGLTIELPISTTIMLRSIIDIARSEGEVITDPHTKTACVEVFALGGSSQTDDSSETGYFAIRGLLSRSVVEAAEFIAKSGVIEEGAPVILRLITKVAARFGVQVSEKIAAQAIPIIGAAGGAVINTLFIDHFQDMARGHFIVRRLERIYGSDAVKKEYDRV
jgi:hypothetical protein